MKRIIALFCAVLCMGMLLCSCAGLDNTMNTVKERASEALSGANNDPTRYSGDNNGLFDDNRETMTPTNPTYAAEEYTEADYTEDNQIGEDLGEMIENGEVEDGDGNVGDLENRDGDPNTDENAAEYAQDMVSADNNNED